MVLVGYSRTNCGIQTARYKAWHGMLPYLIPSDPGRHLLAFRLQSGPNRELQGVTTLHWKYFVKRTKELLPRCSIITMDVHKRSACSSTGSFVASTGVFARVFTGYLKSRGSVRGKLLPYYLTW
jgi:hypothetical protein